MVMSLYQDDDKRRHNFGCFCVFRSRLEIRVHCTCREGRHEKASLLAVWKKCSLFFHIFCVSRVPASWMTVKRLCR